MGCCQHEQKQAEEKMAGGCCGGHGHQHQAAGHNHSHAEQAGGGCCGGMKEESACSTVNPIGGFFKKLFGKKECCN